MNRRLLATLAAATLAGAPIALRAQGSTSILVSAGLSVPLGDLSDVANAGYNVNLGLNFGAPTVPVGARIEASLNSFNLKSGGGDIRTVAGIANAIFNLGPTSAAPYLIGGLGIYNRHRNAGLIRVEDRNVAGVNIGGGLRFPLGGLGTFLEARYHAMLGNDIDQTKYHFVPISFGVVF